VRRDQVHGSHGWQLKIGLRGACVTLSDATADAAPDPGRSWPCGRALCCRRSGRFPTRVRRNIWPSSLGIAALVLRRIRSTDTAEHKLCAHAYTRSHALVNKSYFLRAHEKVKPMHQFRPPWYHEGKDVMHWYWKNNCSHQMHFLECMDSSCQLFTTTNI
jgi:hypothetical protein